MANPTEREDIYRARIGVLLRELRRDTVNPTTGRRYTQAEAAEAVGIDSETLGRWERGYYPPKAWDLAPLAKLYGLARESWHWLLEPPELPARSVRRHLEIEALRLVTEAEQGQLARADDVAPAEAG